MKKTITVLLLFALALSMCACAQNNTATEPEEGAPVESETITEEIMHTYADESGELPEVTAERNAYNRLTGISDLAADMQGKRPFGIEINNIDISWPQYGISRADIIYEMETEGGITRMLALYADIREVERIGPIRRRAPLLRRPCPLSRLLCILAALCCSTDFWRKITCAQ